MSQNESDSLFTSPSSTKVCRVLTTHNVENDDVIRVLRRREKDQTLLLSTI